MDLSVRHTVSQPPSAALSNCARSSSDSMHAPPRVCQCGDQLSDGVWSTGLEKGQKSTRMRFVLYVSDLHETLLLI